MLASPSLQLGPELISNFLRNGNKLSPYFHLELPNLSVISICIHLHKAIDKKERQEKTPSLRLRIELLRPDRVLFNE